jgi:hypothetical protein
VLADRKKLDDKDDKFRRRNHIIYIGFGRCQPKLSGIKKLARYKFNKDVNPRTKRC